MTVFKLTTSAPRDNLRRLLMLRGLFLLALCATLLLCYWRLDLPLPYQPMLWIISGLTLINLLTLLQLKQQRQTADAVFFGQLLVDVVAITWLLYFVGGADNPFVSYYLVPLCIAAATLSWRFTWPLLLLSLGLYSLLFYYRVPLPVIAPHAGHSAAGASVHTLGMWFNFVVSALLISYFVVKMASALRQQDATLASLREDRLRDEQLMAVATLAAGTAHELGTPLTTIKILLHDMLADSRQAGQLHTDLILLQNQVSHCTTILNHLNRRAGQLKDGILPFDTVRNHCQAAIDDWLLLRPEVVARIHFDDHCPALETSLHPTLLQSFTNLLNNAADANPVGIEIFVHWNAQQLHLRIKDQGPGIDADIIDNLGQAFMSQKGQGRGLGLFLTQAAVSRHGGSLSIRNHPEGGTETELIVPLNTDTHTSTNANTDTDTDSTQP